MKNKLQIAGKIKMSTVNGEGLRYTLFLSGCPFSCKGCHSPHTQDYNYGVKEDIVEIFYDIYNKRHYIDGVTISGGEPTEQSETLTKLLQMLKLFNFNIWMWSGNKLEVISKKHEELLRYVDVLIDGQYDINRPTSKPYRGSDNQKMWKHIINGEKASWSEVKEDG